MDTNLILDTVLIVFSIIVGTLLSIVLYRVFIILGKVERMLEYVDHIRGLLCIWEQIPFAVLKKITGFWSK